MSFFRSISARAKGFGAYAILVSLAGLPGLSGDEHEASAKLLAHWSFDGQGMPYRDSGEYGIQLVHDPETARPDVAEGIAGWATELRFDESPGVSTRLSAGGDPLQTNSFGFSFWVRPVFLQGFENFIAKEIQPMAGAEEFTKLAWQVHLLAEDASGGAPVQLLVRGSKHEAHNFSGNVVSTVKLPVRDRSDHWFHIAGGYDASSGEMRLYVDGRVNEEYWLPGANSKDGGKLAIGTCRNGEQWPAFAASSLIDDVQIYDSILDATDVDFLKNNPGRTLEDKNEL